MARPLPRVRPRPIPAAVSRPRPASVDLRRSRSGLFSSRRCRFGELPSLGRPDLSRFRRSDRDVSRVWTGFRSRSGDRRLSWRSGELRARLSRSRSGCPCRRSSLTGLRSDLEDFFLSLVTLSSLLSLSFDSDDDDDDDVWRFFFFFFFFFSFFTFFFRFLASFKSSSLLTSGSGCGFAISISLGAQPSSINFFRSASSFSKFFGNL